ncbi:hypothetical protein Tco_1203108 [Tanacetum coccineum]
MSSLTIPSITGYPLTQEADIYFARLDGNPKIFVQIHAEVVDSGCSSHMTGNKAYLSDYEDFNGGFVAFGSDPKRVNSGSLQVNSGRLLVNSVDFKLILMTVGAGEG